MVAEEIKAALLQGAVISVSRNGMASTTTRSIASAVNLNEAYIYRYFESKDDLLRQAYLVEGGKFFAVMQAALDAVRLPGAPAALRDRCEPIFRAGWDYLLEHQDVCRFCFYYYHSPAFRESVWEEHRVTLAQFVAGIAGLIPAPERAETILYIMFDTLFSFASGTNENSPPHDETAALVFEQLYHMLAQNMP